MHNRSETLGTSNKETSCRKYISGSKGNFWQVCQIKSIRKSLIKFATFFNMIFVSPILML